MKTPSQAAKWQLGIRGIGTREPSAGFWAESRQPKSITTKHSLIEINRKGWVDVLLFGSGSKEGGAFPLCPPPLFASLFLLIAQTACHRCTHQCRGLGTVKLRLGFADLALVFHRSFRKLPVAFAPIGTDSLSLVDPFLTGT